MLNYFSQIFSNHLFFDGWFIPSQLSSFMKGLIFAIFCEYFLYFYNLIPILQHIESADYIFDWWNLFLLSCFLSSLENLYMIHLDLDLFYDICNTINEHSQRYNHYLSLTSPPNWISIKKWLKKFFNNFICIFINHEFYVITLWINYRLLITVFRRNKLIAIVNWIFHISDFLRSFMMSFKYGLILLRYSSIDRILFLSPLLLYST